MSSNNNNNWESYRPSSLPTPGIGNANLGVAKVVYNPSSPAKAIAATSLMSMKSDATDENKVSTVIALSDS